jgi:hypothetical protein
MSRAASASAGEGRSHAPKVVFVMGSGHSGSTILGVALGNCDGVFYAGELDNWLTRSGIPALAGRERTRFWQQVRAGVPGAQELFGYRSQEQLERASSLVRRLRSRERRAFRSAWREVTGSLYASIADASDSETVIDTAHFPLRALELQDLDSIELYLVLLLRDAEAIVGSFTRHVEEPSRRLRRVLGANLDIWVTHLLALAVYRRQPSERRLLVRHEEFLADPARELRRILDLTGSHAAVPDLEHLQTGYPIQGNRLIRTSEVSLRIGAPESGPRSRLTALVQMPLERAFARVAREERHR